MTVECASTVNADPGSYLTAQDVAPWVAGLPPGARLGPIISQRGHQRDPVTVLVGLRATWSEERR